MKDIKTPFWNEVQTLLLLLLRCISTLLLLGCLGEEQVEQLTVGVPSLDAIVYVRAFDRLEMPEGEFGVEGEEEGVAAAFGGDLGGSWPGGGWKVLWLRKCVVCVCEVYVRRALALRTRSL